MRRRVIRAFLAAAVAPVPFGCLGAIGLVAMGGSLRADALFFAVLTGALVSVVAGAFVTCAIGIPAYCLLKLLDRHSLGSYLLAGAAISAIACALLLLDERLGREPNNAQLAFLRISQAVVLVSGPFAAWIFWMIARPDRIRGRQLARRAFDGDCDPRVALMRDAAPSVRRGWRCPSAAREAPALALSSSPEQEKNNENHG